MGQSSMYCSHCGTVATPQKYTKGSFGLEVLLWLLFLLPGFLYSLWRLSSKYAGCPSCGAANMLPVTSPKAQQALAALGPLSPPTPPAPLPRKPLSPFAQTIAVLGTLALVALLVAVVIDQRSPAATTASVAHVAVPNEPCQAEGDTASARAAAQQWCGGGVFTHVIVKGDGRTMTALMQFSHKGYSNWQANRAEFTNGLRTLANEITTKADSNIAISLHDPTGELVGGCVQRRTDREATCK